MLTLRDNGRGSPDGLAREWRQGNELSNSSASIPLPKRVFAVFDRAGQVAGQ
jgi:hypothetical protein